MNINSNFLQLHTISSELCGRCTDRYDDGHTYSSWENQVYQFKKKKNVSIVELRSGGIYGIEMDSNDDSVSDSVKQSLIDLKTKLNIDAPIGFYKFDYKCDGH